RQGGKTVPPALARPPAGSPLVEYLLQRPVSRTAAPDPVPGGGKHSLTVFGRNDLPSSKIWPCVARFSICFQGGGAGHGLRKRKSDSRQIDQAARSPQHLAAAICPGPEVAGHC